VSRTVPRGLEAGPRAEIPAAEPPLGRSRGRGRWVALGVVVVLVAGAVAAWRAGVFSPTATTGIGQEPAPPATEPAIRQNLSAVTPVTATLGYAGSFTVTARTCPSSTMT
jgi:hypothetical protein